MTTGPNRLERLLETLGDAQRDGVFAPQARVFPWEVAASKKADHRAARFSWVRVAIPLAAAAMVAVVFVAPNLMKRRQGQDIARTMPIHLPSETGQHMADAEKSPSSAATIDCDYNGDGVIDGRDIQAFVTRLQELQGDAEVQARHLQKCLLGS
jgi:hypothetical protein